MTPRRSRSAARRRLASGALLLAAAIAPLGLAACRTAATRPAAPAPAGASPAPAPAAEGADSPEGEVSFEGQVSLSAGRLHEVIADELADWNRRGHPKAAIDDAAFHLESYLQGLGHPFAEVAYEVDTLPGGRPRARFRIDEGPRTVVERVTFEGNHALAAGELRPLLGGPRSGWFGTGELLFVESRLQDARDAMRAAYQARGFLEVRLGDPRVTFDAARTHARVVFSIEEGVAFHLESVSFEGEPGLPREVLLGDVRRLLGQPYFPRVAWAIRSLLLERYGSRGYPDAWIAFDESRAPATGDVRLVYTIHPGMAVRVREIRVEGNDRTRDSFILARLHLQPGDLWTLDRERESFRDLVRAAVFRSVDVGLDPAETGPERALVVTVDEAPAIELFAEPGFGSYELFRLTAGVRHRNLFGTGRVLDAQGTAAVRAQKATVGITDRWFLGTDLAANLTGFASRRKEPSFTNLRLGGGLRFTKDWSSNFTTSFDYTFRRSEVSQVEVFDPAVLAALADVDISSVGFTPTYDSRNDLLVPRRGTMAQVRVEWADQVLGSGIEFVRTTGSLAHFLELHEGTVLALSYRAGAIVPFGNTRDIPLQERFFNGGENTVRSFQEDELGPKDLFGNPLGGEAFQVLSAELRQHVLGHLEAAAFYDTGNLIPAWEDLPRFEDFRHGIGLGLRYRLPIGPVRLDGAINPDPGDHEDGWAVHLSVGMAF